MSFFFTNWRIHQFFTSTCIKLCWRQWGAYRALYNVRQATLIYCRQLRTKFCRSLLPCYSGTSHCSHTCVNCQSVEEWIFFQFSKVLLVIVDIFLYVFFQYVSILGDKLFIRNYEYKNRRHVVCGSSNKCTERKEEKQFCEEFSLYLWWQFYCMTKRMSSYHRYVRWFSISSLPLMMTS